MMDNMVMLVINLNHDDYQKSYDKQQATDMSFENINLKKPVKYTDENPKDTVGIKYATIQDAKDTIKK